MDTELVFNGLDGATGRYVLATTARRISDLALGEELDASHLNDVRARVQASDPHLGVGDTVDDVTDRWVACRCPAWTSSTALTTLLSGQQIFTALWNGRTWSAPRQITTDPSISLWVCQCWFCRQGNRHST